MKKLLQEIPLTMEHSNSILVSTKPNICEKFYDPMGNLPKNGNLPKIRQSLIKYDETVDWRIHRSAVEWSNYFDRMGII